MNKADYVREQATKGAHGHHCHWPGCDQDVPPAMWGCKIHWFTLPLSLRNRIWKTYRPGQEIAKNPSAAYVAVAREVQDWIKAYEAEGTHTCQWPGCQKTIRASKWACGPHWKAIPCDLRLRLFDQYKPLQELGGEVSDGYKAILAEFRTWLNGRISAAVAKKQQADAELAAQPKELTLFEVNQ